jgi:hypothetical protein
MPVLKFGEINLMIVSAIFGPLDVSFMKCAAFNHLFKAQTWTNFTKQSKEADTGKFQIATVHNWGY